MGLISFLHQLHGASFLGRVLKDTMPKSKASTSSKGQSNLNAFIVKKKPEKKAKPVARDERASEVEGDDDDAGAGSEYDVAEEEDVEEDVEMGEAGASEEVVDKKAAPDKSNLPPISSIPAIFTDLVSRIPEVAQVTSKIKGRKLRVATMCSGTESPLLALELIQESIEQLFKTKLEIDHVFSCEIEPFKQAYIERNFSPPILFRDICELGGDTAYVLT